MHPQLDAVLEELAGASARFERLAEGASDELWAARPEPGRWSAAECVAHLNLTWAAFEPRIAAAMEDAEASTRPSTKRFRRNLAGWLIWKGSGPGGRFRVKTGAAFEPEGALDPEEVRRTFREGHRALTEMIVSADGSDLARLRIVSPFDSRFRYNLYACFTILARHEHRHLAQAEAAVEAARTRAP